MIEDQFTEFLKGRFPFQGVQGIGDDCSVERVGDFLQLITKDLLVEDVHFRFRYMTPAEIALKALAVNVSDIAAMGGIPRHLYLGLGVPNSLSERELKDFFSGVQEGCKRWGLELAGGDLSRAEKFLISVTMVGRATRVVFRSNACTGDLICLSFLPGRSSIGLELLEKEENTGNDGLTQECIRYFKDPPVDLELSGYIAEYANAMIDVSDGLIIDLKRLLRASSRGARIHLEQLELNRELASFCREKEIILRDKILSGGEDYCLLFTISPINLGKLGRGGIVCQQIGRITEDDSLVVFDRGEEIKITNAGFDHFAR
jgi:thiamine-monophosphate kinase